MSQAKTRTRIYHKEALVILLLIAAFIPTILWMFDRWFSAGSYYSHGILVPIVSFLLIFRKKEELQKIYPEASPWGFRLFVLGIILYWASALVHVYFTSGFAMLIVIAGLVLHFYGGRIFREILFPILFLVFMIPLPIIVVAYICFKLKILATCLATFILNCIGFPSIQETSLIRMQHTYVLVEDRCAGLRSLISLTALGSIFAYRLNSSLTNKIILFLSAIPIATITNAFRIVFLAVVGEKWGTVYTQGFLHDLSGYMVFGFAFLMLLIVKKLFEEYGQS